MITLEEPPIKRKRTESFCLEEPLEAEHIGESSPEIENNIGEIQSENENMKIPIRQNETKSVTTENKTKRDQNLSEKTNDNKPNKRLSNGESVNEIKGESKLNYGKEMRSDSDDKIEKLMEYNSRRHTRCLFLISKLNKELSEYEPHEVESIMETQEVKETLDSVVEVVSRGTSEFIMDTIYDEIMEEIIKELQELIVENEAESNIDDGIKDESSRITKEAMLSINLEQLEQKRKTKKEAKRKPGENSQEQDEIERDTNTEVLQSSQEEGLTEIDNTNKEHGQEEILNGVDIEDTEEIIRKQREDRKLKRNERRKQREIVRLRNLLKETKRESNIEHWRAKV